MKRLLIALLMPLSAAAYTDADITRNSACGAPGIGKVWSGPRQGQIEAREGKAGYRVSKEGWWSVGCVMPPPPRDCPEKAVDPWRGNDGWRLCTPAKHSVLRAQNIGREWSVYTAAGADPWGSQRWRCERQADGSAAWVLVRSHCAGR